MEKTLYLADEAATLHCGEAIADHLRAGMVIYLQGELGAGKTTLTRGVLRGLGYEDRVKSPTYTIVEEYGLAPFQCFHFDCYRLQDPEQLRELGLENYFTDNSVCLIEWPSLGEGVLPPADLTIQLSLPAHSEHGRNLLLLGHSDKGHSLIGHL